MNHQGTKRLETDRLILRRFTIEDAQEMYDNWASEDEVTKFLTWPTHANVDITKMLLTDWVSRYDALDYYNRGIELKETYELIRNILVVMVKENTQAATLGYCMGTKWWGQEIMPEAGKAGFCNQGVIDDVWYSILKEEYIG